MNDFYGSDANNVYCLAKKFAADRNTFKVVKDEFGQDKSGLWFNGFHVPNINVSDLKIRGSDSSMFAHDTDHLFSVRPFARIGKGKGYARLLRHQKNGDAQSFEILSDAFAKDKKQVYCFGEPWKAPDPATFEVVMKNRVTEFARDCKHLYGASGKKVFKNVDVASFEMLNKFWARDKNSIIYMRWYGKVMRHIDHESFEVLDDEGSARDARKEYWMQYGALRTKRR